TWQQAQPSASCGGGTPPPQPAGRRRYGRKYQDQDPCRIPQLYVSSTVAPASSLAVVRASRPLLRLARLILLQRVAGIPHRRRNHITAARPLSLINLAAKFASEGELRICVLYQFLSCRAT